MSRRPNILFIMSDDHAARAISCYGAGLNSTPNLGDTRDRNRRLRNLLDDFANPKLDMRPSRVGHMDVIGNAYEYLIGKFASGAGKKGGEFYTPPEVSVLLAKLLAPKSGETIYDPACGSVSSAIFFLFAFERLRIVERSRYSRSSVRRMNGMASCLSAC